MVAAVVNTGLPRVWQCAAVPHATFGVVVVEEVPQIDSLHLQT